MHQSNVEQAQEKMEELRQELRTQVQDEVRSNVRTRTWRRLIMRAGGCCGIYLVTLLAIPAIAGYFVARTGLVNVPWLSERVVHERAPSRLVTPVSVKPEELLAKKIAAAMRRGEQPTQITVSLSEGELTGLLQSALADRGSFTAPQRTAAQVALQADHAEVFMRVPAFGGGETTVRIRGTPNIRDGKVALDLREIAIGNMGIPRFLAQAIVNSYLAQLPSVAMGSEGGRPGFMLERVVLVEQQLQVMFRVRTP